MPAITYRLTSVCAGGNHYTLELSGAVTRTLVVERDDLARLDDIDPETFALALLRFFGRNRTPAQIRTALQNGVTITVGT